MLSSPTTLLTLGVIFLALAIVIVVVWVAYLASKINRMQLQFMQELDRTRVMMQRGPGMSVPPQAGMMPPEGAMPELGSGAAAGQRAEGAAGAAGAVGVTGAKGGKGAKGAQNVRSVPSAKGAAIRPQVGGGQGRLGVMQPTGASAAQQVIPATASKKQAAAAAAASAEADKRSKPKKGHKGKPVIPFGVDKRAQDRAREAYAPNAVESDYDPDSIDFSKVQGLQGTTPPSATQQYGNANTIRTDQQRIQQQDVRVLQAQEQRAAVQPVGGAVAPGQQAAPKTRVMGQNVQNVAPVRGVSKAATTGPIEGSPRQRQMTYPRQRSARVEGSAAQQPQRMPSQQARMATAQTRAGFQQLEADMRERALGSTAWIEEDKRRTDERLARQARLARLSEEREHAQLHREAEFIVRAHERRKE